MRHFAFIIIAAFVLGMAPGRKSSPYPLIGLIAIGIAYAVTQNWGKRE